MRLLYMGTPDFALPTLARLAESGYHLIGVVTQPDRAKGRGRIMQPTPVKERANSLHIPVFQPAGLKGEDMKRLWSDLHPDMVIVVSYGYILPSWIIHGISLGCINLHASLLPRYRGAAPINWAIIQGEGETGVTTILMDEGMDTGPILLQERTPIMPTDTAGSLHDRLSLMGAELVLKTIKGYTEGTITPRPQSEEGASLAPKLDKEIGRLDWHRDNHTLCNLVRGINPYPGAFGFLDRKMIKIWSCLPVEGDAHNAQPGMICDVDHQLGLIVQTGNGRLAIRELQPESKKRMNAQAFVSGYRVNLVGSVITPFPDPHP